MLPPLAHQEHPLDPSILMLRDVPDHLEQQRVASPHCPLHQQLQSRPSHHLLCVEGVAGKVDPQGHHLWLHQLLRVVEDHLHQLWGEGQRGGVEGEGIKGRHND